MVNVNAQGEAKVSPLLFRNPLSALQLLEISSADLYVYLMSSKCVSKNDMPLAKNSDLVG